MLYQHSDVGGAVVAEMVRRRATRRLQGANSKLKKSLRAADLLSNRQYFTKEARHRTIDLCACLQPLPSIDTETIHLVVK